MKKELDPYRYFFPAGWLLGLWGVILWVLFPWGLVSYPGGHHPEIMMGGFFLCFVAGFLMTAAPRFTSTWGPTAIEHAVSGVLIALLLLSAVWYHKLFFFFSVCLVFIFLMRYMAVRFLQRKSDPPDSFIFLGFGLVSGFLGALGLLAGSWFEVQYQLTQVARAFFLNAYIMCLVVGVGSRLIPALMGFAPLPTESPVPKSRKKALFILLGVLFLGSYFLEVFWSLQSGYVLRSLVLSYILFSFWQIQRTPARRAFQTWGLWVSAWSLLLGHWAIVFFEAHRVHILHFVLISGLALMTLMIAVRVSLSHGKHAMILEKNSKSLAAGAGLLVLAGLTRLSAGFAPHIYESHLLYAAITWILALIVWGAVFVPKIIKVAAPSDEGS